MIKLDKKTLDDFIKLTYQCINMRVNSFDTNIVDERKEIQNKLFNNLNLLSEEISGIIWSLCNLQLSHEDIYAVLNILGYEVFKNGNMD